ncbi:MAG: hypothetical protein MHM6MM_000469 [Cercozoa sp. M6MM]
MGEAFDILGRTSARRVRRERRLYRRHVREEVRRLWRRLQTPEQMDWQVAKTQFLQLFVAPRAVIQAAQFRRQIKGRRARDDPAFLVLLCALAAVCGFLGGFIVRIKTGLPLVPMSLLCVLRVVLLDVLLAGAVMASLSSSYLNREGRRSHSDVVDYDTVSTLESDIDTDEVLLIDSNFDTRREPIEWLYCFDVHCNALVPTLVLARLLPSIVAIMFIPWLSNLLQLAAAAAYCYICFLGFSVLPGVRRTERLLYCVPVVALLILLACLFNVDVNVLYWTFRPNLYR